MNKIFCKNLVDLLFWFGIEGEFDRYPFHSSGFMEYSGILGLNDFITTSSSSSANNELATSKGAKARSPLARSSSCLHLRARKLANQEAKRHNQEEEDNNKKFIKKLALLANFCLTRSKRMKREL